MTSAAAADWLLDTGPLVALLSKNDAAHAQCRAFFEGFRGRLVTSEAVLTEAVHLMARAPAGGATCLEFFLRGAALLVPVDAKHLAACRGLIEKYHDVPMDYADATLVALADRLGIGRVVTLDRRGFEVYRWRRTRRFSIAP